MIKIEKLLNILDNVWPYLVAILAFLILIIIHEFGHFIAAKAMGVRVNEFAVGFGPKLFSIQGKETKYAFNLIPLGGYCAMEGEDETSEDDRAFCNKKAWRRFIIVVMGAVFNLIFGIIIIAITLIPEPRFATTIVAEFSENAISAETGLQVNDEILEVNGRDIYTLYDLSYAFSNVEGNSLDITVKRDGERKLLEDVQFKSQEIEGINYLTWDFKVYGKEKTVGSYLSETFNTALSYGAVVWRSLIDLITGKYGISAMSGVVGTTAAMGEVVKQSFTAFLPIVSLITINLGIFNLLPIPALDGGRVFFILIEIIIGRPITQKWESKIHAIGMVLLLLLMAIITVKDIWTLIV